LAFEKPALSRRLITSAFLRGEKRTKENGLFMQNQQGAKKKGRKNSRGSLAVNGVLVLLETNGSAQNDLVPASLRREEVWKRCGKNGNK